MRQIKFRGETFDGRLLYGDLIHQHGKVYIDEACGECIVKPESVAQFVTTKSDGTDLYEGDKFIDSMGIIRRVQTQVEFPFVGFSR